MKICNTCKVSKPLSEYHKDRKAADGYSYRCKSCAKEASKKWKLENPERYKESMKACWEKNRAAYYNTHNDRQLMVKYKLTREEYNKMLAETNGSCPICSREFGIEPYTKPVVDHCHRGGHTRGIICRQCNIGLGAFRDDTESMKKAIQYLENDIDRT